MTDKKTLRGLSPYFMHDLMDGFLHPLLIRVHQDDTLMLAIRGGYINVYYRGGNILELKETGRPNIYSSYIDENYFHGKFTGLEKLPSKVQGEDELRAWLDAIPYLKDAMDLHKTKKSTLEREFQQLVVRENNNTSISNDSEYFFTDIEFAETEISARFDMIAVKWLSSHRQNIKKFTPVFVEMKYGDKALTSPLSNQGKMGPGLVKHLKDFIALIEDDVKYRAVLSMMKEQFVQLCKLGLIRKNKLSIANMQFEPMEQPEFIFLLSNHNPRTTTLLSILESEEFRLLAESKKFVVKFFVSSVSGYGMHSDCMMELDKFCSFLKNDLVQQ